MWVGSSGG
jgi:hypothetical protein